MIERFILLQKSIDNLLMNSNTNNSNSESEDRVKEENGLEEVLDSMYLWYVRFV